MSKIVWDFLSEILHNMFITILYITIYYSKLKYTTKTNYFITYYYKLVIVMLYKMSI